MVSPVNVHEVGHLSLSVCNCLHDSQSIMMAEDTASGAVGVVAAVASLIVRAAGTVVRADTEIAVVAEVAAHQQQLVDRIVVLLLEADWLVY